MTVTTNLRRTSTGGDGSNLIFSYNFKISESTELGVFLVNASNVSTRQTLNTDYTVQGVGQANGSTITFTIAPAATDKVLIHGETPTAQAYDPTAVQVIDVSALMAQLDKQVQMIQELTRDLGYVIKWRVGTNNFNLTLDGGVPDPAVAGTFLEADTITNPPDFEWSAP